LGEASIIILDLRLGQEDGLDLLREIRSRFDVPIIIATGHRCNEIGRVVGSELGADDYVTKAIWHAGASCAHPRRSPPTETSRNSWRRHRPFAIMALLTGIRNGGPPDMLCLVESHIAPAQRNGRDVPADERVPFGAMAESDLPQAKPCSLIVEPAVLTVLFRRPSIASNDRLTDFVEACQSTDDC
jgi:CheY-like chemotaxis protein